jgi:hypothetical protein
VQKLCTTMSETPTSLQFPATIQLRPGDYLYQREPRNFPKFKDLSKWLSQCIAQWSMDSSNPLFSSALKSSTSPPTPPTLFVNGTKGAHRQCHQHRSLQRAAPLLGSSAIKATQHTYPCLSPVLARLPLVILISQPRSCTAATSPCDSRRNDIWWVQEPFGPRRQVCRLYFKPGISWSTASSLR